MDDLLIGLEGAVAGLRAVWAGDAAAAPPAAGLSGGRPMAVANALGALGRRLDAVGALVAAEVDRQSRQGPGADSLAKQQGFRTASALIAAACSPSRRSSPWSSATEAARCATSRPG